MKLLESAKDLKTFILIYFLIGNKSWTYKTNITKDCKKTISVVNACVCGVFSNITQYSGQNGKLNVFDFILLHTIILFTKTLGP